MKKLLSMALIGTLLFGVAGNAAPVRQTPEVTWTQQKKEKIKVEDLPEGVRKAVKEAPYEGWEISAAYKIPGPDKTTLYEVELKKGPDVMKATFDKDGNKIV